jgi:hypothetical protein
MHCAERSWMPLLLISLVFARIPLAPMPLFAKPIARAIAERGRASFVAPQLRRTRRTRCALPETERFYPANSCASAYQRALERGGPFELLR